MNKGATVAALTALIAAGCSSTPETVPDASGSKIAVVQVGTKQNAELTFCRADECPQRTPKRLPPPPPAPVVVTKNIPAVVQAEPKQVRFKVHFRWGWSRLDKNGREEVEAVVASGSLANAMRIEVAGRTDPTGPRKFNEKLAVRRAQTVKDVLVMAGVPAERITAAAQSPCCDGDLTAPKAVMRELRRTDIEITVTTK